MTSVGKQQIFTAVLNSKMSSVLGERLSGIETFLRISVDIEIYRIITQIKRKHEFMRGQP